MRRIADNIRITIPFIAKALMKGRRSRLAGTDLDYLFMDVLNPDVMSAAVAADLLATGEIFSWAGVPGPG